MKLLTFLIRNLELQVTRCLCHLVDLSRVSLFLIKMFFRENSTMEIFSLNIILHINTSRSYVPLFDGKMIKKYVLKIEGGGYFIYGVD